MGMFNKSVAKKMASDASDYIVNDGKLHARVCRRAAARSST